MQMIFCSREDYQRIPARCLTKTRTTPRLLRLHLLLPPPLPPRHLLFQHQFHRHHHLHPPLPHLTNSLSHRRSNSSRGHQRWLPDQDHIVFSDPHITNSSSSNSSANKRAPVSVNHTNGVLVKPSWKNRVCCEENKFVPSDAVLCMLLP